MSPPKSSQRRRRSRRLQEPQEVVVDPLDQPTSNSPAASQPDAKRAPSPLSADSTRPVARQPTSPGSFTNGNLDGHADEPDDQRQPQRGDTETTPKKRAWDPFARYHSDANSFPSYAAPKNKMSARDRLKKINAQSGPANTFLRSSPSDSRKAGSLLTFEPAAKRQKQDDDRGMTSAFFAKPRKLSKEEVQDLTAAEDAHEIFEIRSTSSAGKVPSAIQNVTEFRKAQPKAVGGSSRKRKSRASSGSQGLRESPASSQRASPMNYYSPGFSPRRPASDSNSADDLAMEENPPPANIVSDLMKKPAVKRSRPPHLASTGGPQIKRNRMAQSGEPVDDDSDEDELNQEYRQETPTRPRQPDSQKHLRPKPRSDDADIKRTTFTTSRTSKGGSFGDRTVRLSRAVSGQLLYDNDDGRGVNVYLHFFNAHIFEPTDESGNGLPFEWLRCDLEKGRVHVLHSATKSRYVTIERSATSTSARTLYLEFSDLREASRMIHWVPPRFAKEEHHERLEKAFRYNLNQALNFQSNKVPTNRPNHVEQTRSAATARQSAFIEKAGDRPKREKLVDGMLRSSRECKPQQLDLTDELEVATRRTLGPDTRRTRRSTPTPFFTPERWTSENTAWGQSWDRSLVFPATGKNRATVDKDDIPRLDEGEFLNDNLISFYLRYLQVKLEKEHPELLQKIYFFSTFFFEKLRSTKGKINYDGVKAWTAKVDLFSYDYIVVPVNEHAHWYLALILNAPNALNGLPEDDVQEVEVVDVEAASSSSKPPNREGSTPEISLVDSDKAAGPKPEEGVKSANPTLSTKPSTDSLSRTRSNRPFGSTPKNDPRFPRIITLDSLGSAHSQTVKHLKEYLSAEALNKRGADLKVMPTGLSAKGIPEQGNYCDCGVYVLGYMQEFLKNPDEAARKLLRREDVGWSVRAPQLRSKVRELLFDLHAEQEIRLTEEREAKRRAAIQRRAEEKNLRSSDSVPASRSQSEGPVNDQVPSSATAVEVNEPAEPPATRSSVTPAAGGSSPTKLPPHPETPHEKEVMLISRLKDDSSHSGDSAAEAYFSAPSSPGPKVKNGTGRITKASQGPDQVDVSLASRAPEPHFVKGLSSSPDNEAGDQTAHGDTQASVEFVSANQRSPRPNKKQKGKRQARAHSALRPRQSIEVDEPGQSPGGPQYDGIDRTVDLTS